jgi:phosphatidate cytidylyltransferase
MIETILLITAGLFLLGGCGMYMANRRADADTRRRRWTKFGIYIVIVYTVLGSAIAGVFVWLVAILSILAAYEMVQVHRRAPTIHLYWAGIVLCCGIYLTCAYGLLAFARTSAPETIVFVYLTVAVFDGFSQVVGQLFGRHQLARVISPGKTVEGSIGGLLMAVGMAWLLRTLPEFSTPLALLAGGVLGIAGLMGDLSASWYKRAHGVKDFGRILPSHGGILDRFDSLFAAGAAYWFLFQK